MRNSRSAQYLTTAAEVQAWTAQARSQPWLSLDTEFMRERTYYPQLCLVQVGTPDAVALIDAQCVELLPALVELLNLPLTKIMHAPGQDQEVLATVGVEHLQPLYDTQTAHALLGGVPQIGYAGLVAERLQIAVDKGQTRTDWSRRPLSADQCAYAAADVEHLPTLHAQLEEALEAAGRSAWMAEEMQSMARPWADPDPTELALRARAMERMEPAEQQRYVQLVIWREERARRSDKPRSWVAKDGLLVAMARRNPGSAQELRQINEMPEGLVRNQGEELLACLTRAEEQPVRLLEPVTREAIKPVQAAVARAAEAAGLERGVVASRADCEQWCRDRSGRLASGWRHHLVTPHLDAAGL